jgi:hypothetical protein
MKSLGAMEERFAFEAGNSTAGMARFFRFSYLFVVAPAAANLYNKSRRGGSRCNFAITRFRIDVVPLSELMCGVLPYALGDL